MKAFEFSVLIIDDTIISDKVLQKIYSCKKDDYQINMYFTGREKAVQLLSEAKFNFVFNSGRPLNGLPADANVLSGQLAEFVQLLLKKINMLEDNKDEFKAILNSISEGIEACDINGRVKNVNPAFSSISGIEAADRLGKNILELNADGVLASVLKTKQPVTGKLKQGPHAKREVIVTGSPIMKDETMIGAVVVVKDVSETINMAREIQNKREMLTSLYNRFSKVRYTFEDISRNSKSMKDAIAMATRAAHSLSTILITGESGTGKELFAQSIHFESKGELPFISVNCATIPENLLEGELFGHEKGAFTDASSRKIGLFQLAQTGTVFLDEIGDLNLNLQAKLLRVLQEREFRRVGGIELIPFNARVIAATNRDLTKMVNQDLFRKDLFYRLNVMNIHVPPLRERIEDLPVLLEVLLHKINRRLGKNIKGVEGKVLAMFSKYAWPGNVRELENILERAVNICTSDNIGAEDIDLYISRIEQSETEEIFSLEIMEKRQIKNALKYYGQDLKGKKAAAQALGISLTGLYQKIKKYDIER